MPGNIETVTVASVSGNRADIRPALARNHPNADIVVEPGTGLELAAPTKFMHAGNLPFSARGTGISFTPASAFTRYSNEPVQPLGSGITLDRPLAQNHAIHAVVRGEDVATAGYQGNPAPNQWFGGPALSASAGAMILRDGSGKVVDSLNYGLLVDPWAAKGYHGASGTGAAGCRVTAPGAGRGAGGGRGPSIITNSSASRMPDGRDSDSNCTDFVAQPATVLPEGAQAGANNIKVAGVADFAPGQSVFIDSGANQESATITQVGTPGASTTAAATDVGATAIPVNGGGFAVGQAVVIDNGANRENATIAAMQGGRGGARLTVSPALRFAHPSGALVAGSGITLAAPLARAHAAGAQVITDLPTPGAPNKVSRR
jgi:hypothetical protein